MSIDYTDIGCSDHFLVWMELGRIVKSKRKVKRVIRKWRLDRFENDEIKLRYQNTLKDEVNRFSESISSMVKCGMKGHDLVHGVLTEWENIVKKVAKNVIGEKFIVCGKSVSWWDDEIKDKISLRRELHKRMMHGQGDLWEEYCRVRKEVKELVRSKKIKAWNKVVEEVNNDYDGSRKQFWSFVSRKSRGKKGTISSLRNESGISVSSVKGKLEILEKHYENLGKLGVDNDFDEEWREIVRNRVNEYENITAFSKDNFLDSKIVVKEILRCIKKLKNNKAGGNDGVVGELLKYGGIGMALLLQQLYLVIWSEEYVPRQWREGLIVNLFKKGDREDPGNYRGITLLSVVGKVFCKVLNNRLVQVLDKERVLHEGQAGFRVNRSCMDNVYTLNELVQGRIREDKQTYAFFLDVRKAYDTVWHDGLWCKLWDMGIRGKMWRVIKNMYKESRSVVFLEGQKSDSFKLEQGVTQGCSLSPILFSVFINDLLKEVDDAELGIELSTGRRISGMLFADDFVGVSDSKEHLQKLIDVVHMYCNKWRLKANVSKSAVMVFSKDVEEGDWMWGKHKLPNVSSYSYLGIDFSYNGAWDMHIKKVLDTGKRKLNQLNSIISNRNINLSARRLLLLSVIRPSLEYGNEIWEGNKCKIDALESIILRGARRILGCSSKTCNEAVRGDMGLESLKSRRDKAKLRWWYKLLVMPDNRYPKQLFNQSWNVKPRRGRQRKVWGKIIDNIFESLNVDKKEWLECIENENSSLKSFMICIQDSINERECKKFEEGLNSKVKLQVYKMFCKHVEFKKYLHGVSDGGTRLMFKFRSGTHGLNEELGRHRDREGKSQCPFCGYECESVTHVLWECLVYSDIRNSFLEKLKELLGDRYVDFATLSNIEKSAFVLGSELWEEDFDALLQLVKEFIVELWEHRKQKLYGSLSSGPRPQPLVESMGLATSGKLTGKFSSGKFNVGDGSLCSDVKGCVTDDSCVDVCGSVHGVGRVVNGRKVMAAI